MDGSCHHLNSSQPPQPSWWPWGGQPGFKGPKCPGDLQPPLWFRRNLDNKQGSCLGAERLCTTIPGPAPFQPQEGAQGTPGAMGQSEKGWMSTLMHPLHLKTHRWIPRVAAMGAGTVSRPGRAAGGRRGQQYQSPVGAVVTTRGWFLEAKGRVQPPRAMLCHGTAAKMHLASAEGASAGGCAQGTSCHEIPSQAVGRSGAHHPHPLRCAGRGQSHSPHYPKFLGLVEAESSPD